MNKKLTLLAIAFFYLCNLYAQQQAPLNKEFVKFMENKDKNKINPIIPSPNSYIFSHEVPEEIKKLTFPASYDLRTQGYVTSVKNQGGDGHCWSFAAIGAVESRNMKLGIGTYDLSEHNMATCHGFVWSEGGNQDIATAYYSRLSGPLSETQDPYIENDFSCSAVGITPQFYVTENRFLPRKAEVIKYYLMNYGAIAVSYYTDDLYYSNNTYFYSGTEGSNHAVLLVGWDDNKTTQAGKGAWIIKNSWGTSWGENGYFYMSYNDSHAIDKATIYPIRKELHNIDTLLMIDKLGETNSFGFNKSQKDYGLIKYNVSKEYNFTQIGTFIGASNSMIDIEVFSTKTDDILSDTLAKVYGLFAEYPGYYTFDVPFKANGDFYVKVGYNTPGDDYPIPVESSVSGYSIASIQSGVCWISDKGDKWQAVGNDTDSKVDVCIRVYGTREKLKASFTADRKTICYDSDVTFTSNSIGTITNYSWNFGSGATPATANTAGPHTVTYSSNGFKTIKLKVEDADGKDSLINYEYINVKSEINLSLLDEMTLRLKDTVEIFANGGETYLWSPSDSIIGNNNKASILISPDASMTYYVTGSLGSCLYSDSIKIEVVPTPENDDVCDATLLTLNVKEGPFSNVAATVQLNEPFPDTTGSACTTPMKWCSEGGLQNSIWFKFVANSTAAKIETKGANNISFDNQIAVYSAEVCEDIISGNSSKYTLIAANDDVDDKIYDAKIDRVEGMVVGKTYWLQLDGSGGGKEGQCTITITSLWGTGLNNKLENNNIFSVYPNPNSGDFKLRLTDNQNNNKDIFIEIISTDGSVIRSFKGESGKTEYDLNIDRKGFFIVRLRTNNNFYTKPLIIK